MADIILHQYATSPFSEKIRLLLGAKKLDWLAVEIPPILPKPDLLTLSGGYRRTPVMQIGADVYCDTALICEVLDRRTPTPPLYPHGQAACARLLAAWIDTELFTAIVTYLFQPDGVQAMLGHLSPTQVQAFVADRKAMRGDTNALRMPLPEAIARLHATFARFEQQFAAGVAHVAGAQLSVADFSLYHNVWFLHRSPHLATILEAYPLLLAWYARLHACGHGRMRVVSADDAIEAARHAEPLPVVGAVVSATGGFAAGDAITVTPTDYARDPVPGALVALTDDTVILRREDPRSGVLNVHFPRQGYQVRSAA
jgi:glutathione S-transferase